MIRIFEKEVQQLTGTTTPMGVKEILLERRKQEGVKQGEANKSHSVVENLITKLGLSDEQAADVAEVSVAFVKQVRKELEAKK